jgi:hypothetical protein
MKTAIYCSVIAFFVFWCPNLFGQGTCHNGGANNPGPGYPYTDGNPNGVGGGVSLVGQPPVDYLSVNPYGTSGYAGGAPQTAKPAVGVSTARITVVSADALPNSRATTKSSVAKLTIVTDETPVALSTANAKEAATESRSAVDSTIAKLVGIWKAVARHSNGELTTVELRLDNDGWAELTVPGSDGKPNTTKSRVNLDNEELKLTDADKVVSLGRLMEYNSRQMVLERADGHVTFVRR